MASSVDRREFLATIAAAQGAFVGGIAALLRMLNSCANGVAVVNIDNGFGAACMASAINHP